MRRKVNAILLLMILLQGSILVSGVYADRGGGRGRGGRDEDHRGSHYRHYRYYPRDYYYNRRIYYYPKRVYYHYYDVTPSKINYYQEEKEIVALNPTYLPITSIANMCSQGIPEDVIIDEIKRTGSTYKLTSETITYLKQNGAQDRLINFMLESKAKKY